MQRRQWMGAAAAITVLPRVTWAQSPSPSLEAALAAFTGGAPVREGRVTLDIPPLVENGNAVPVTVAVPGVEAAQVRRLALFTERNPQPEVLVFTPGPLSGRAAFSTRMRLATSQTVVAVAHLADGSPQGVYWQHPVTVVVTLAACVEGG